MKKLLLVLLVLGCASVVSAQNTRVFTLQFNHDGLNTDTYFVEIDGTRTIITPACTGTGDTRLCTSPVTLVLNIVHNVKVVASGTFGEASSVPFVCDVPKVPVNNRVTK